jgi:hypothetical protein
MSWKPEVQTDDTGRWYSNSLRFATEQEAKDQVLDLYTRWLAVRETRVVESDDPVNYKFVNGTLIAVMVDLPKPTKSREEIDALIDAGRGRPEAND